VSRYKITVNKMAYRKPGFKVKQEYILEPQLTTQIPRFPAGIIGASNIVIEGQDALVVDSLGQRITYKTGEVDNFIVSYPKRNELYDVVDLNSVKVYLIPGSVSFDIGIRNFSREYFRGFPPMKVPEIDVSYVDITKVVKENEWMDDFGNTVPSGITADKIVIPKFLVDRAGTPPVPVNMAGETRPILIDGTGNSNSSFAILVEYKAQKKVTLGASQSFSLVTQTMSLNQTVFELRDNPIKFSETNPTSYLTVKATWLDTSTTPATPMEEEFVYYPDFLQDRDFSDSGFVDPEYWVDPMKGLIYINPTYDMTDKTLTVEYNIDNPIYSSLQYIQNIGDIETKFGVIHPLNPIAYGCYLHISGSGQGVYAIASTSSSNDFDSIFDLNDMVDIQDKLNYMGERGVYAYTVLSGFSILPQINAYIKERESKLDYVKFALGFNGFNDASTNFALNDKQAIVEDIISKMDNINEKRIDIIFNPVLKVNYKGINYPVPGIYGACAVMALTSKYMNESTPHYQLTYQSLPEIVGIYYPLDNRLYFNELQIETLSSAGLMVLEQGVEGVPTLVDQVTTDTLDSKGSEHSVVSSVDWSAKDINNVVQNKLKNTQQLTMSSIRLIVDIVNARLKEHANMGLIGNDVTVSEYGADPENPKYINLTINYFPELPMKGGIITLKVRTR